MSEFYFTVPGEPVPKGRPRFGRGRVYTPKKTADAEKFIKECFNVRYPHHKIDGKSLFHVTVNFYVSHSKFAKADLDNLIKTFLDALNDLLWVSDSQVTRIESYKVAGAGYIESWISRVGI